MIEFMYGMDAAQGKGYILTEDEVGLLPREGTYVIKQDYIHSHNVIPTEMRIFMEDEPYGLKIIEGLHLAVEIISGNDISLILQYGDLELCRKMGWEV